MAKEKESREAAEARTEAKAEARADEQRKQHEALLKILSQLQSPSGHEKAKNQDTPVQEVLCPRKVRPIGISLAQEGMSGTLPP